MTREEQAQLNELARELSRCTGATEEAMAAMDRRMSGLETRVEKRLDSIDAGVALIRAAQAEHGKDLARIPPTCIERGKAIDNLVHCVNRLQEHDRELRHEHSFSTDELTPPPYNLPVGLLVNPARSAASTDDKETFWAWLHARTSALAALLALLGALGGVTFWLFKTYNSLQAMQDFISRASDGGFHP